MEDRIEDLQTRLAFQEHMLEQFNQAVTKQQRQLDDLGVLLQALQKRLGELAPSSLHFSPRIVARGCQGAWANRSKETVQ